MVGNDAIKNEFDPPRRTPMSMPARTERWYQKLEI